MWRSIGKPNNKKEYKHERPRQEKERKSCANEGCANETQKICRKKGSSESEKVGLHGSDHALQAKLLNLLTPTPQAARLSYAVRQSKAEEFWRSRSV